LRGGKGVQVEKNHGLFTRDVSSKGAFILTPEPLPVGANVNLELKLTINGLPDYHDDEQNVKLRFRGKVVRACTEGMAVMFSRRIHDPETAAGGLALA
jgi:hypothetical protein